jgi:hypothetical protein
MKTITIPLVLIVCLVLSLLTAQAMNEIDINNFYTEKKALIKETLPLTDKESQTFWLLYDDYMKGYAARIDQRIEYERGFTKKAASMTEEQARDAIDKHYQLISENLAAKKEMLKKLRRLLPEKKVLQFFQLEEKIEIGFFCQIVENVPLVK